MAMHAALCTSQAAAALSTPETLIEEARNGRMLILIDAGTETERASLVLPAQLATPTAINFMTKFGRGLVCLALTMKRVRDLGLPLISPLDEVRRDRSFAVSIEAREGVSTGISAADRARTIATAIDIGRGRDSIVSPGHVFPLVAHDGGVLARAGHTEAAVDLARLAGLNPSGVICDIMDERGMNARIDDLVAFAAVHRLRIGAIRDLVAYRYRHDRLVEQCGEGELDSRWGGKWKAIRFVNRATGAERLALVKGEIATAEPLLVRLHAADVFRDLLAQAGARPDSLERSMLEIGAAGRGIVLLDPAGNEAFARSLDTGSGEGRPVGTEQVRDHGTDMQILTALGVRDLILLVDRVGQGSGALDASGLNLVGQRRLH